MKLCNLLLAGAMIFGLASCSSDEPVAGGTEPNPQDNGFYSKVTLKLPVASRSTEKEGDEIGQDFENKVGSILVVLATKDEGSNDYKYLTYAKSDAPTANTTSYTIVFQDKVTLFGQAGKKVYAFAYCNPSATLVGEIEALEAGNDFTDKICSDAEASWTKNGFLMTSVSVLEKELPDQATLKTYNTPANAYPLGTIEVIRTASRFDIRDYTKNDFTYSIVNEDVPAGQAKPEVAKIKLLNVAMFNQRNEFYYLPRNSVNNAITLCPGLAGMEVGSITTPGLILSPDTRTYSHQFTKTESDFDPIAHGNAVYNGFTWKSLAEITGTAGTEDNDESWKGDKENADGYYIWRYTSENTFADATPTPEQTTGFIFEAEIDPTNIPEGMNFTKGEDVMYVYANKLYVNAAHIYNTIADKPVSGLSEAFNNCFNVAEDGTITVKADADFEGNKFTVFAPDATDKKYYTYYFAYNRHNDNNDPTTIGEMEYATVRNNVYKLQVTKVTSFGGFTPGEVENWDVYFQLEILVRDWVVRINNIEF